LVVIAKLTHKRYSPVSNTHEGYYIYTLETDRILRGKVGPTFRVYEENSSGRASFGWRIGESYLLFLDQTENGMWSLYGCGNSAPLGEAGFVLKVVDSLKGRHGGLIQGRVTDDGSWPRSSYMADLSGVRIEVRGKKSEYTAVTNREGEFKMHVPVGQYTVSAVQPGWTLETDIVMSYEDPSNIRIENGGGAQVQFMMKKRK
jgi:hypothetical protein